MQSTQTAGHFGEAHAETDQIFFAFESNSQAHDKSESQGKSDEYGECIYNKIFRFSLLKSYIYIL